MTQMSADFQKAKKDPETYAIIGALAIEFGARQISFRREFVLPVFNLRESAESADKTLGDESSAEETGIKNINLAGE
ncbi:MAG TPA: hypothetical protein VH280_14465 [Verrucomicrobiae bacterium]|nr:hypothetical protein [Verrucomicrobiae bacterium]